MSEIDRLYSELRSSLRGFTAQELRAAMRGLEPALAPERKPRRQLTLRRLRFDGEKRGDFRFRPGVNVLRAGNDKGKSSILKLVHFCLTGKNDLKKDVDGWIERVELAFDLDGVPHLLEVAKKRRPRGRLLRLPPEVLPRLEADGFLGELDGAETVLEFRSGKRMQEELEAFFNRAFGLRPLRGTQKDSRKGSDALLDATTSYRAYFRGMYVNQDMGYTDLVTDGVPYGNLFMKVVGMLLGMHGIDAHFAVEAQLAHLQNELGKEERYHRRLEESLGVRDLATLDAEIGKLETYVDELKLQRTALLVRATSGDLDQRLRKLTNRLVALDNARLESAGEVRGLELELEAAERGAEELAAALASHRSLAVLHPERCPVCETAIAGHRRHAEPAEGSCILCHEEMPERDGGELEAVAEKRLVEARSAVGEQRRGVERRRAEIQELDVKIEQLQQQKRHLQAQLRSAHQGTEELEREIELETRYLGRLEAEREAASRVVSEDGSNPNVRRLLRRKQILETVLRHLRTRHADANERMKRGFAERVREYCTLIGLPGLEDLTLDPQLRPRIRQNGKLYAFDELSPGERVRFVLAFYLAMAIATAEELEYGAHPGLLLIDSPGKEEMVLKDFEAVVGLLRRIEERHAGDLQALVATSIPAIHRATRPEKQVFVENDEDPLFG